MNDTRTITAQIAAAVALGRGKRVLCAELALCTIRDAARRGELSQDVYVAADGILFALGTGRLPGALDIRLRAMSGREILPIVARAATQCPTIADVPRWLIASEG